MWRIGRPFAVFALSVVLLVQGVGSVLAADPPLAVTVTLQSSEDSPTESDRITLTAILSPTDASGTVEFFDVVEGSDISMGTADVDVGQATLDDVRFTAGTHELEARYSGDATYGPATGHLTLQILPAPPLSAPNVVVIALDDVPYLDGRLFRHLPTIRQVFMERGTTYTDFHGETPICCPGRVGFFTGQHTHHHGVLKNDVRSFRPGMSLATALDDIGYRTFLAGKYLNKYSTIAPAVPPGWDRFHAMDGAYYGYRLWSNGGGARWYGSEEDDYSTDVVARKAVAEIRRAPTDVPIFGWIAPSAAHLPRTAADRHKKDARCSGIEPWSPPNYMEVDVSDKPAYIRKRSLDGSSAYALLRVCRVLLSVDDLVADVRDALQETGRLGNTLLILTSDNGMTYGAHRIPDDKKTPYATQLPFMVSWPDRLGEEARLVDGRLMNIDLAPTICALTGCTIGPYPGGQQDPDGLSFADRLLGDGPAPERASVLYSYRNPKGAVPRWWGIGTTADSQYADEGCSKGETGRCRWLYVTYETGERELYDLHNGPCWTWQPGQAGDPCMLQNRAGDPSLAALQAGLAEALLALRRD